MSQRIQSASPYCNSVQVELISCIRDTGSKDCHNVSSILFKSLLFSVRGAYRTKGCEIGLLFLDLRDIKDKSVFVPCIWMFEARNIFHGL